MLELAVAPWVSPISYTLLYIGVGLLILLLDAVVTDLITPGKLWDEICQRNLALAIVTIGSWIGSGIIIGAVISGSGTTDPAAILKFAEHHEVNLVLNSVVYAAIGIVLKALIYKIIDWLTPKVKFSEELKTGNAPLAVLLAGLFVAVSLIIAGPLSS